MSDRFTNEQRAAIEATGKVIVSASAGSGKTTVMIEKIIRMIRSGVEVGEILAVTFTKKAASQMKEKLCKALIKAINDPATPKIKRVALKKQLADVPNAEISTIHSFCSRLIRSHFFTAGVDSGFRVIGGDDAEGTALKNEALDELLDEGYEEKDPSFAHLLAVYWRKKSDKTLRKIILSTYNAIRDRADYRAYLERSGAYDDDAFTAVCNDLYNELKERCAYYLRYAEEERAYFADINAAPQLALATELIDALSALSAAPDYFSACAVQKPKFTAKRTSKKDDDEKRARIERLAEIKKKVVEIYDDLSEVRSLDEEKTAFLRSGETAAALAKQILKFDEKYERLKSERGVLDYNDLEHKALALLRMDEVANEVREKYRYVFVDEYQDVNPVQEELLSIVGGNSVFLVGDVKQSIYGFRGSKSKFFIEKQKSFELGAGTSLAMTRNFRSADAVLDAVNTQFSLAMNLNACNIDYAARSYMERGGMYALNDGRVQIHFMHEEEKKEELLRGVYSVRKNAGKRELEESVAAKTIRGIIEQERKSKFYDPEAGEYREVRYSDIAILSRKKQGQIATTVAALSAEGVPVTTSVAVNICDYAEIKTLIDILSLLDNAEQDIALCSALSSAMGDFDADELAAIRLRYPDEHFFRNACKKYAVEQTDKTAYKLNAFFAYFKQLRSLSSVLDAGELLTKLMSDTHMEARLLSRDNGVACLKRIHRFIEETAASDQPLSLHAFLDRLRDLDYKIEYSENGGEDSVQVLTMHASKGLEYPVVIVDNLNAPFRGVGGDEVFVEEEYGLAPRAFDLDEMTKCDTLLRRLHARREYANSVADELNLYYVALTRAKYALHMLFKKRTVFPDVKYAGSFADFTDFSVWDKYIVRDEPFDLPKQPRTAFAFHPDEALTKEIMGAFTWEYAHGGFENFRVKSSATELISQQESSRADAGFSAYDATEDKLFDVDETFDGGTSRELGIAYHAFLERFDFSLLYENGRAIDQETLRSRVQTAYEQMQAEKLFNVELSLPQLVQILSNPAFYTLQDAQVYKERQFLVSLPIKETYGKVMSVKDTDEEMIFQGAIDLLAVGEDGVRIIDYKYSTRGAEQLKTHYAPQLSLYKLATAKILGVPLEKISCSIVNIRRGFQVDL
ncbi:MAG: UvrD-helicase domain-containing protein [Clostridia bacterium]|nr:UvrD-helicase domain-containing protein [Clostridia bacterium]